MAEISDRHDMYGVPICPGDLLKSFHFTDRRRKRHYLYHVAVKHGDHLMMIPTQDMEPSLANHGGRCLLSNDLACSVEVIAGHGPGDILSYEDRPKWRKETSNG